MQADIEMRLVHNGVDWVATNDSLKASGATFEALDENLKRLLLDNSQFSQGQEIRVFMGFDFSTLPTWLRQYHSHYFNRIAILQL